MFKFLRQFLAKPSDNSSIPHVVDISAVDKIATLNSGETFPVHASLSFVNGMPVPDWTAVWQWVESLDVDKRHQAWTACERSWLAHFTQTLGKSYRLTESKTAMLVSSQDNQVAAVTHAYMEKTLRRIVRVLDGVAATPEFGKDLLILFDDDEAYYHYVARYYPDEGEFAASSGMYLDHGCGHFVSMQTEFHALEPVIAHEMTHACLGHLPLPAWLNEGLAVNTENRLAPRGQPLYTPEQMQDKHRQFWGENEIQEFWSGKSFLRADDGNLLSYDLAQTLVAHFAADWDVFKRFANAADLADAGSSAAVTHLGVDLGLAASALLEKPHHAGWNPAPENWQAPPEKGAF
ncbi:MAG: hypothetical protein ABL877_05345 [Thiobacillus sp.]